MNDLCEAFLRGAAVEEVKEIVEAHPKYLLYAVDQHGKVPLHYACRFQASRAVIDYLCRTCPQSLQMATLFRQELPLHVACCCCTSSPSSMEDDTQGEDQDN